MARQLPAIFQQTSNRVEKIISIGQPRQSVMISCVLHALVTFAKLLAALFKSVNVMLQLFYVSLSLFGTFALGLLSFRCCLGDVVQVAAVSKINYPEECDHRGKIEKI